MKSKPILKFPSRVLVAAVACAVTTPALAGGGRSYSSIVRMEIIKRQQKMADALNLEAEGDKLAAEQDHGGSQAKYNAALSTLPMGTVNEGDRARIAVKFAEQGVIHADELARRGAFDRSRSLLTTILSDTISPGNKGAQALLKNLDDPDIYNPAMSDKHYANTEEVRRLFRQGLGFYDLGDFRQAETQFNRILTIDPTNVAAQRQKEACSRQVSNYLRAARDSSRIAMLNKVDELWSPPVPTANTPLTTQAPVEQNAQNAGITYKLNNIIIETISFDQTPLADAVNFLTKKSAEFDPEPDPLRKGISFVTRNADNARPISVRLRNQKLIDVVKLLADQAGVRYDIQANAVVFVSGSGGGSTVTRQYSVPPDWRDRMGVESTSTDSAPAADPFAADSGDAGKPKLKSRPGARQALSQLVELAEKDTVSYANGILTVRTSYENHDIVERWVEESVKSTTKQVYITTKFVEVSQRNTDELGFDWLMGAFGVGGSGVFGSGGTNGTASPLNSSDFAFSNPGAVSAQGAAPVGSNPITRGLRFGSDAISRNAIDSIIAGGVASGSAVSPAAFALAGVFTDPQFQVMMRALSQKKGVDLMTAPSIMVRSGQKSKIEVIREFPYPTEFDPPQIPQTFGGGGGGLNGGLGGGQTGGSFPVTPTTPSTFQFKNTGVTMEVEANVADDNYTIDLTLNPEVIEFDGFINYGSPIQTTGINALGQSSPVVLTANEIRQPVFATRRLETQVMMYDRQTVGVGGLIREDVQSVEDKIPLFSSLPVVGRLFKTKAEETFKRNLMIYVSGTLKDLSGQDVHGDTPVTEAAPIDPNGPSDILIPTAIN